MLTMPAAPDPCVIVIFGASGDLVARKLIPALYEMAECNALPDQTRVLGVSRTEILRYDFLSEDGLEVLRHAELEIPTPIFPLEIPGICHGYRLLDF